MSNFTLADLEAIVARRATSVLHIGGVPLADVMDELKTRTARTGLEEKASRPAS